MIEDRASDILDHGGTEYERAHADTILPALIALPAEEIESVWNALTISADLLPLLAHEMGVKLYEENWRLDQKRQWVHNHWNFLAKIGTLAGTRMALAACGYTIQEVVRSPQGFYASPEMTKEETDVWLGMMPELRITYGEREGQDNGQWFAGVDFEGELFAGLDDGPALRGRYGFLRRNGVDTPLVNISEVKSEEQRSFSDIERMSTPGLSTLGFFADESASDDFRFVDSEEIEATIVSFRVDRQYRHEVTSLALNVLIPGLEPIDIRHRVISDVGDAGEDMFADDAHADDKFSSRDMAEFMLADSLRLLDPAIAVPMTYGASFANVDRVGLDLRTTELLIDLHTVDDSLAFYADVTFVPDAFSLNEDTSHIDRAMRAVEASRAILDRILVRFDVSRPLQVNDPVTDGMLVGTWVKNSL